MTSATPVVVDTMVVSALVHAGRDPQPQPEAGPLIRDRPVVVSFVTVTEMRFGAITAGWGEVRRRGLERVLSRLGVVRPDDGLMRTCAELRADCVMRGHALADKLHEADRWIGATATALDIELVSRDDVFRNVTGLVVGAPSD